MMTSEFGVEQFLGCLREVVKNHRFKVFLDILHPCSPGNCVTESKVATGEVE